MKIVSIVIPTFNRLESLKACLAGIQNQSYPSDRFEVIVADDGSSDGTAEFLEAHCKTSEQYRFVRCTHAGQANARNVAAKIAKGEWLAFIDDDCVPSDKWIEEASTHFDNTDISIIEGQVISEARDLKCFDRTMEVTQGGRFLTCNIFYRKSEFDRVCGFSVGFPRYREDTDLAWRVLGHQDPTNRSIFESKAEVCHRVNRFTIGGLIRQAFRLKRAYYEARLCKEHPKKYRSQFAFFRIFNPTTIISYPLLFSIVLVITASLQGASRWGVLIGAILVLYCYATTVVLYFSVHGGVSVVRMMRDAKSITQALSLWWIVLISEFFWGVCGALRFRVALF